MSVDSVLAPLADRYAHWLGLDAAQVLADREEAAHDIRAMQLVLRMERSDPPSWHRAVALAAGGAAAICLDERSEPGGEWHDAVADYVRGHIRKVTRRARGAHWVAAQDLPGRTLAHGGTDVPPDEPPTTDPTVAPGDSTGGHADAPSGPDEAALRLWMPAGIPMTVGKAMAQAGHAGMICAALLGRAGDAGRDRLASWRDRGYPVTVQRVGPADWATIGRPLGEDQAVAWERGGLLAVRDAGF